VRIPVCFHEYLESLNKDVLKLGGWVEKLVGFSEMGNEYESVFENRGANRANNRVWFYNPSFSCRANQADELI